MFPETFLNGIIDALAGVFEDFGKLGGTIEISHRDKDGNLVGDTAVPVEDVARFVEDLLAMFDLGAGDSKAA